MKTIIFHHIVDACVEFCFLKKQFLNLTINMQLYYYCDQPSSFSQAPSACGVQCSTERLVLTYFEHTATEAVEIETVKLIKSMFEGKYGVVKTEQSCYVY